MWESVSSPQIEPETELQRLFDDWPSGSEWSIAGAPAWLLGARQGAKNERERVATAFGYAFAPDVKWPGFVVELKSAAKYEPLGLAEVLHHAWAFGHTDMAMSGRRASEALVPVLVTRWNGWNRASLAYLFEHGLRPNALKYLEVCVLRHGARTIAWFDEPFGGWSLDEPPAKPPGAATSLRWRKVRDADAWIGSDDLADERPLFPRGAMAMVARASGGGLVGWSGETCVAPGTYFFWP